jgi:RNA polymerase sigma-70 factor (ECF subfamily)
LFSRKSYSAFNERDLSSVLSACRAGDRLAQRTLYRLFFGYGKSLCLRYADNADDAEEILNDGFLKLFQSLGQYNANLPFKAWFRSILIRSCVDYHRRRGKFDYYFDLTAQDGPPVPARQVEMMAAEEVLRLVQELPASYRTVFVLYVVDEYSHAEIAELLGIAEVTSRSHYTQARLKLQEQIRARYSAG